MEDSGEALKPKSVRRSICCDRNAEILEHRSVTVDKQQRGRSLQVESVDDSITLFVKFHASLTVYAINVVPVEKNGFPFSVSLEFG